MNSAPGYGCSICGPDEYCPDDAAPRQWEDHDPGDEELPDPLPLVSRWANEDVPF